MKRAAVLLALVFCLSAQTFQDEFSYKVLEFEKHWSKFLMALAGCPPEAMRTNDPSLCSVANQHLDRKEYEKARKAAIELFAIEPEEFRKR